MANSGANPLVVLEQNLPAHLSDLRDRRQKLTAELWDVNREIARVETHLAVSPADTEKKS